MGEDYYKGLAEARKDEIARNERRASKEAFDALYERLFQDLYDSLNKQMHAELEHALASAKVNEREVVSAGTPGDYTAQFWRGRYEQLKTLHERDVAELTQKLARKDSEIAELKLRLAEGGRA